MVFGFVAARARGVFGETFGVGAGVIATATACRSANAASLNSGVAWLICGVGGAVALIWASQHPDRHERSRFTQTAATEISASTAAPTLSPSVAGDGSALDIELFMSREFIRGVLQSTMDYADYEGGLSLGGLSLGGLSLGGRGAKRGALPPLSKLKQRADESAEEFVMRFEAVKAAKHAQGKHRAALRAAADPAAHAAAVARLHAVHPAALAHHHYGPIANDQDLAAAMAAGGFSWGDFKKLASSAANTAASTAMRLAAENPELVQMGLSHAKSMAKKKLGFGGRLTNQQLIGLARRF